MSMRAGQRASSRPSAANGRTSRRLSLRPPRRFTARGNTCARIAAPPIPARAPSRNWNRADGKYCAQNVGPDNVLVMEDDRANYKVFNVGTGKGTKVLEFAKLLRDAYEAEVDPLLPREFRPTDFRHLIADNSNIRALGWQPTVQVSEGVQKYVQWILSKPRPKEYFSDAEKVLKGMRIVRSAASMKGHAVQ